MLNICASCMGKNWNMYQDVLSRCCTIIWLACILFSLLCVGSNVIKDIFVIWGILFLSLIQSSYTFELNLIERQVIVCVENLIPRFNYTLLVTLCSSQNIVHTRSWWDSVLRICREIKIICRVNIWVVKNYNILNLSIVTDGWTYNSIIRYKFVRSFNSYWLWYVLRTWYELGEVSV